MSQILPERPFSRLRMSRVSPLRPAPVPGARGRAYVGQQRAGAHALRARQAVTGVDVVQTQVGVLAEMGNQCQHWISKPWFIMVYLSREGTTPIAIIYHNLDNGAYLLDGLMGLAMVII